MLLVLVGALAAPASAAAEDRVSVETDGGYVTVAWSEGFGGASVIIRRGARGAIVASSGWMAAGATSWRAPVRLGPGRYIADVTGGCPPAAAGQVACLGMWGALAEFVVAPYRAFRGGTHLAE